MSEEIRNLVDALVDGNSVEAKTQFDTVIGNKVSAEIDNFRTYVARAIFNPNANEVPVDEPADEEVQTDEEATSEE